MTCSQQAIRTLTAERDDWKARAKAAEHNMTLYADDRNEKQAERDEARRLLEAERLSYAEYRRTEPDEIAAMREQLREAREALKDYGGHVNGCDAGYSEKNECTCKWWETDAALKGDADGNAND